MGICRAADISNWQNLTPSNARALKASGVELVIVRLSHEYQQLINTARAQCKMVLDAGMHLQGYVWAYFTEAPVAAASYWHALYDDIPLERVWVDCEAETRHRGTPAHNVEWLHAVLDGLQPWPTGVYTGRWWWVPYMGNSKEFTEQPLWDADYTGVPNLYPISLYGGWNRRYIHQYSGNGSLAGINPLDLDLADEAILGAGQVEEPVTDEQLEEMKRISQDEIIFNLQKALTVKRLPRAAREALQYGALPAAQTLARGFEPE